MKHRKLRIAWSVGLALSAFAGCTTKAPQPTPQQRYETALHICMMENERAEPKFAEGELSDEKSP